MLPNKKEAAPWGSYHSPRTFPSLPAHSAPACPRPPFVREKACQLWTHRGIKIPGAPGQAGLPQGPRNHVHLGQGWRLARLRPGLRGDFWASLVL